MRSKQIFFSTVRFAIIIAQKKMNQVYLNIHCPKTPHFVSQIAISLKCSDCENSENSARLAELYPVSNFHSVSHFHAHFVCPLHPPPATHLPSPIAHQPPTHQLTSQSRSWRLSLPWSEGRHKGEHDEQGAAKGRKTSPNLITSFPTHTHTHTFKARTHSSDDVIG